jgi:hypothetical protein
LACRRGPPSVCAHLRLGTDGGTGLKPGDRHTLPLCWRCHQHQHQIGERLFWAALGIDPHLASARLFAAGGDLRALNRVVQETWDDADQRARQQQT